MTPAMNVKDILYDWGGLNQALFHAFNGTLGPLADRVMWAATSIAAHQLFPLYLAAIAAALLLASWRDARLDPRHTDARLRQSFAVLSVLAIAYCLDGIFLTWAKAWYAYPRPLLVFPPSSVHVVGEPEYVRGFPSGHASFAMTVAAALWPILRRRARALAVLLVASSGASRLYVGAHFPADVVWGWLSSLLIVLLVRAVVERLLRPGAPDRHKRGGDIDADRGSHSQRERPSLEEPA